jgi:Caspase domain
VHDAGIPIGLAPSPNVRREPIARGSDQARATFAVGAGAETAQQSIWSGAMAYRALCIVAALAASFLLGPDPALAENRVALVIGNSAYEKVAALPNPQNDAKAMAQLLNSAGFEVVLAPNLAQADMHEAIRQFLARVTAKGPDTVVLVFYAGHGLQVDGENYLVPVDAQFERESDVSLQGLRLSDLMQSLAAVPSRLRIVMLDACRNNPFSAINKTTGRGLAIVDAPAGSLVSYSTSPGAQAEDGTGADSPYTAALVRVAQQPGLAIEQALKRVRVLVNQQSDGRQTPWESSSLTSEFAFFPRQDGKQDGALQQVSAPAQGSAQLPGPPPSPPVAGDIQTIAGARRDAPPVAFWRKKMENLTATAAYQLAISEDNVEAYEAFVSLFSAPPFVQRVRGLLERRQEMVAWYAAVTIDTQTSYLAFLAAHPNSDFALTAQRLQQRAQPRSLLASNQPGNAQACSTTPAPQFTPHVPLERRTELPPPAQTPTALPPVIGVPPRGVSTPTLPPVFITPPPVVINPPGDPVPPVHKPPVVVNPPPGIVFTPVPPIHKPPVLVTPVPPVVKSNPPPPPTIFRRRGGPRLTLPSTNLSNFPIINRARSRDASAGFATPRFRGGGFNSPRIR